MKFLSHPIFLLSFLLWFSQTATAFDFARVLQYAAPVAQQGVQYGAALIGAAATPQGVALLLIGAGTLPAIYMFGPQRGYYHFFQNSNANSTDVLGPPAEALLSESPIGNDFDLSEWLAPTETVITTVQTVGKFPMATTSLMQYTVIRTGGEDPVVKVISEVLDVSTDIAPTSSDQCPNIPSANLTHNNLCPAIFPIKPKQPFTLDNPPVLLPPSQPDDNVPYLLAAVRFMLNNVPDSATFRSWFDVSYRDFRVDFDVLYDFIIGFRHEQAALFAFWVLWTLFAVCMFAVLVVKIVTSTVLLLWDMILQFVYMCIQTWYARRANAAEKNLERLEKLEEIEVRTRMAKLRPNLLVEQRMQQLRQEGDFELQEAARERQLRTAEAFEPREHLVAVARIERSEETEPRKQDLKDLKTSRSVRRAAWKENPALALALTTGRQPFFQILNGTTSATDGFGEKGKARALEGPPGGQSDRLITGNQGEDLDSGDDQGKKHTFKPFLGSDDDDSDSDDGNDPPAPAAGILASRRPAPFPQLGIDGDRIKQPNSSFRLSELPPGRRQPGGPIMSVASLPVARRSTSQEIARLKARLEALKTSKTIDFNTESCSEGGTSDKESSSKSARNDEGPAANDGETQSPLNPSTNKETQGSSEAETLNAAQSAKNTEAPTGEATQIAAGEALGDETGLSTEEKKACLTETDATQLTETSHEEPALSGTGEQNGNLVAVSKNEIGTSAPDSEEASAAINEDIDDEDAWESIASSSKGDDEADDPRTGASDATTEAQTPSAQGSQDETDTASATKSEKSSTASGEDSDDADSWESVSSSSDDDDNDNDEPNPSASVGINEAQTSTTNESQDETSSEQSKQTADEPKQNSGSANSSVTREEPTVLPVGAEIAIQTNETTDGIVPSVENQHAEVAAPVTREEVPESPISRSQQLRQPYSTLGSYNRNTRVGRRTGRGSTSLASRLQAEAAGNRAEDSTSNRRDSLLGQIMTGLENDSSNTHRFAFSSSATRPGGQFDFSFPVQQATPGLPAAPMLGSYTVEPPSQQETAVPAQSTHNTPQRDTNPGFQPAPQPAALPLESNSARAPVQPQPPVISPEELARLLGGMSLKQDGAPLSIQSPEVQALLQERNTQLIRERAARMAELSRVAILEHKQRLALQRATQNAPLQAAHTPANSSFQTQGTEQNFQAFHQAQVQQPSGQAQAQAQAEAGTSENHQGNSQPTQDAAGHSASFGTANTSTTPAWRIPGFTTSTTQPTPAIPGLSLFGHHGPQRPQRPMATPHSQARHDTSEENVLADEDNLDDLFGDVYEPGPSHSTSQSGPSHTQPETSGFPLTATVNPSVPAPPEQATVIPGLGLAQEVIESDDLYGPGDSEQVSADRMDVDEQQHISDVSMADADGLDADDTEVDEPDNEKRGADEPDDANGHEQTNEALFLSDVEMQDSSEHGERVLNDAPFPEDQTLHRAFEQLAVSPALNAPLPESQERFSNALQPGADPNLVLSQAPENDQLEIYRPDRAWLNTDVFAETHGSTQSDSQDEVPAAKDAATVWLDNNISLDVDPNLDSENQASSQDDSQDEIGDADDAAAPGQGHEPETRKRKRVPSPDDADEAIAEAMLRYQGSPPSSASADRSDGEDDDSSIFGRQSPPDGHYGGEDDAEDESSRVLYESQSEGDSDDLPLFEEGEAGAPSSSSDGSHDGYSSAKENMDEPEQLENGEDMVADEDEVEY